MTNTYAGQMPTASAPEMTLRDYWAIIVRRKWLVLLGVGAYATGLSLPFIIAILLQNEEEDNICKLQSHNKQDKEVRVG